MRRFLTGWILIVLLLPFVVAWIYYEWSENNRSGMEQDTSSLRIDVQTSGGEYRLGVTDFLAGAVAAQIPADYELETLKAQTILARTCLLKKAGNRKRITASDVGMRWLSESERKQLWGSAYKENNAKIIQAVHDTDGQILYSGGQIILPAWFFIGNGKTRNAKEVWGEEIAWLQSVESEWDQQSENYKTEVTMTRKQMIYLLKQFDAVFECTADSLASNCAIVEKDASGYVLEIQIGNRLMTGEDFRYALDLPSACFEIRFEGKRVLITAYGQGSGLGFDQYGANCQAKEGKNAEQLLQYYLTGVKVGE